MQDSKRNSQDFYNANDAHFLLFIHFRKQSTGQRVNHPSSFPQCLFLQIFTLLSIQEHTPNILVWTQQRYSSEHTPNMLVWTHNKDTRLNTQQRYSSEYTTKMFVWTHKPPCCVKPNLFILYDSKLALRQFLFPKSGPASLEWHKSGLNKFAIMCRIWVQNLPILLWVLIWEAVGKYTTTLPQEHTAHVHCDTEVCAKYRGLAGCRYVIQVNAPLSSWKRLDQRFANTDSPRRHVGLHTFRGVRPSAFCRAGNTVGLYAQSARANTRAGNCCRLRSDGVWFSTQTRTFWRNLLAPSSA